VHVDVNGIRLWFDVDGPLLVPEGPTMRERPTVVLLHGGPGSFDHSYLQPDFGRLSREAQVVYLDLRGHGRSEWGDPDAWSFEACADDVRAFCDVLGIVRPVVYGHSLGGMVAMLYAARHPGHPGALILDSTTARFDVPRMVENFRRIAGDEAAETIARTYGGDSSKVTAEQWARCWALFGRWVPGAQEKSRTLVNAALNPPGHKLLSRFNALDQLGRIDCPTLVCVGALDPCTPTVAAREIVAALPAGAARLEIIEGAGHFSFRDNPERYWSVVAEFVATAAVPRCST
jgi:pimeloyl-ACP methyl ester carboxylesterase